MDKFQERFSEIIEGMGMNCGSGDPRDGTDYVSEFFSSIGVDPKEAGMAIIGLAVSYFGESEDSFNMSTGLVMGFLAGHKYAELYPAHSSLEIAE